jgi:hypothetical protein
MEALKLAFDTIIVGALALPWIILMIDLFLRPKGSEKESIWFVLWSFLAKFQGQADKAILDQADKAVSDQADKAVLAVAGVFLFAAAYLVGAAVTRVSGDFFNDDDLWILGARLPTEDNIRTDVYCDPVVRPFVPDVTTDQCQEAASVKTLSHPIDRAWNEATHLFMGFLMSNREDRTRTPTVGQKNSEVETPKQMIQRTFYRQEAALLLKGSTDRLNQLHSQVLVLRGAAFDGLITLLLCLFAIGGQPGRLHAIWSVFPTAIFGVGSFTFLFIHLFDHGLDDPPFMEFTTVVLGLVGLYTWRQHTREHTPYLTWFLIALLLTLFAGFGWWWSEVLYDRLVLYSFYAMTNQPGGIPALE